MIFVQELAKHYRVHRRKPGLWAAARSIFRREYSSVKAVDDITFEIAAGERVGFLGPNGAGKTTTLKVLAGLLYPTSGQVRVGGHVPQQRREEFLRQIMLVTGQKQQLIWDLPPAETFELNRAIYDVPRARFERTVSELVELLELGRLVETPARQLSLGERMKCELVAALVHRPQVLFLDEPTIGLDVAMQTTIRRFIREYNERYGATVLLTSHYMDDVVALCPRVIVIDRGKLTYEGSLELLTQKIRPEKRIVFRSDPPPDPAVCKSLGRVLSQERGQVVLLVPQNEVSATVQRLLSSFDVKDLSVESAPLEEVMSELFERGKSDGLP
jgi:ABC-2 type transport system ATP-binding protein